jgi:GMP synthase-like glutamine amidotransferase
MRAHYFQHVPFEELGSIRPWLEAAGCEITVTQFFKSWELPDPGEIDLLVVMGGPMSVNDEIQYPWILPEKDYIRNAVRSGKSVLGICLGAQLIASAMGARVYKNSEKEIGWFPVNWIAPLEGATFEFPASSEVFHWHGETFDLPNGALQLANSAGCKNQAFQLGKSVIGLQFHLESTKESTMELVQHCRDELVPSRFVQTEKIILSASPEKYRRINAMMGRILDFLF